MCDELFGDSDNETDMLEKSWKKTIDGINKDGYRAGIDVGQEECIQEGFNAAFRLSSKLLYAVSELRGIVSGKLSYNLLKPGSLLPEQEQLLQTLVGDIVEYETELLKFSKEGYIELEQKCEQFTCSSEADEKADREADISTNDRPGVTGNAAENNSISEPKSESDTGNCDNDIDTVKVTKSVVEEKEKETVVENQISHFKRRLKEILTSGT